MVASHRPNLMDQYIGTYYLINKHGHTVSTPIVVSSTRGATGTGGDRRGYMVLQDGTILKSAVFLDLLADKKLIRDSEHG